jgi:hypothetical protein
VQFNNSPRSASRGPVEVEDPHPMVGQITVAIEVAE